MNKVIGVMLAVIMILCAQQSMAAGYSLVWSDEFDGYGLPDPSKWTAENWEPYAINNELQKYVTGRWENTRVENGVLKIEARRDWYNGYEYTSGRISTRDKFSFTRGVVEVRAQLPKGRGAFPAIFMLPQDYVYGDWPDSGEIGIMENVGYQSNSILSSIQSKQFNFKKAAAGQGEEKKAETYVGGAADGFHTYRLEWTENFISVSVDQQAPHFYYGNPYNGSWSWPFDRNFYLILNTAVGGGWGGIAGIDNNSFPQLLQVDYVRVYQWQNDAAAAAQTGPNVFIEAENYKQASNVSTEDCWEGGKDVGFIDAGDWLRYTVNVPKSAWYTIQYRLSSLNGGGQILADQNGRGLGSVVVPQTWDWQNWQTVTQGAWLEAGVQDLGIYADQGGFNLNWIQLIRN
ncbi:MAG: carbohydrate-binding protein [Oligoflexus sp.]|nr:carbohydrate-binding protein [Oligoflexus sp.]